MMRKQAAIFLIVGGLTASVDYICYFSILWAELLNPNLAKSMGFLMGTIFAYFANRFWTFGRIPINPLHSLGFLVLYASTMAINIMTNAKILEVLGTFTGAIQIAFVTATAVSAILNFLGMKFFVFSKSSARL